MSTNVTGGQGAASGDFDPAELTPEQELEENLAGVMELIQNLADDSKKTKKGEKKDKAASSGVFEKMDVFGLLGDIVGKPGEAAKTVSEFLRNPGTPGGPKIFPPIRDLRDMPTDGAGTGNPWLEGSVFTDLIMILFEIMPILFQIKLQEAALEAEQIVLLQEVTIEGAKLAKKKKELEAKELRMEAYKQFVQAGVQLAMAGVQAGVTAGSSIKGGLKSAAGKLKTAGGMGYRGTKMAGSWGMNQMKDGWAIMKIKRGWTGGRIDSMGTSFQKARQNFADRKTLLAGKLKGEKDYTEGGEIGRKQAAKNRRIALQEKKTATASERAAKKRSSLDAKKQESAQRMMARNQMITSVNQSLTGVVGGLFDLEKAKIREQIGVVEYLQGVFQGLQNVHQKMIDSSHEARREASEAVSTYMQQFANILEAQKAFRQTR